MNRFEYDVSYQEIVPPIGGIFKYAGKVTFLYDHEKKEKIIHEFGETHGKTTEEAISKMSEKVEEWVKNQK